MGGLCSKNNRLPDLKVHGQVQVSVNPYKSSSPLEEPVLQRMEKPESELNPDDFYDGIPRFTLKSRSVRSTQAAVAKVSEVSSRLGRASTVGLGKAMDVLDTLGSSMTNLNPSSGFLSGVGTKSNELKIVAFEVANTIVKGSNLMQSLSKSSIRELKEVVLLSKGVQNLVSKDMDELLNIVAADKREELKIFTGEVVRFGNRTKDPQWHNLNRYFQKISQEPIQQSQVQKEAELVMEQLMTLVQNTAELYHELQVLDRFEQDYQRKRQEEDNSGDNFAIWGAELKSQRKLVKSLKKKSLWSKSLEEVMEKLVDIVHFLLLEMHDAFGSSDADHIPFKGSMSNHQRLGPAGLALHYANLVMQIDTLVARSSSMPPNTRDALYQSLPPTIKSGLRFKVQSLSFKDELTVTEIKDEMEKTLQWLVPTATNTAKAHHGFGWVGEWANTGSDGNRKSAAGTTDVIRIETLHHADKEKTEAYILDLVLWLHHLVNQVKMGAAGGGIKPPITYSVSTYLQNTNRQTKDEPASSLLLTPQDREILENVYKRRRMQRISKSHDFDRIKLTKYDRLSKSTGHSLQSGNKEKMTIKRHLSHLPIISFGKEKEKVLDVIDRVDELR
ncbi:protein PSK SIMULATOR 1-like [Mangifera indica]|uniref:protein PSK SIMULATOR 1-like n=1 Tax=Mangifera indica TaxID=29780 RepID=UPI001CFB786B|nr:protein PSK SIMULATOR 1-like [Mangifera indica]